MTLFYDLIIVGAGISGSEVAWASAKRGLNVLLVTTSLDTIYNLLGDEVVLKPYPNTLMANIYKTLNTETEQVALVNSWLCHCKAKYILENHTRIHLLQSSVSELIIKNSIVKGVTTWEGVNHFGSRVILCVGGFLKARLTIGGLKEKAGRLSEMAYDDLYNNLLSLGFEMENICLKAELTDGSLPYTVNSKAFTKTEWQADTFKLSRIKQLYAVGVCAQGYLPFEEAALKGKLLAEVIN